MALVRWQATVQDDFGNIVVNPVITVRVASSGALATIYNDAGVAKANPFTGSTDGFVSFKAAPGTYQIEGVKGGQSAEPWIEEFVSNDESEQTDVFLAWGQSNMEQDEPRAVIKPNGTPLFIASQPHWNITVADNGDGTYTQTYIGRTSSKVRAYNPATNTLDAITSDFNNVAIGAAVAHAEKTGRNVVIVRVARGSMPIERFLSSSQVTVTGVSTATPAVISVSDVRFIPLSLAVPIRFTGVGGSTGLNSGEYAAKTATPAWSTYRTATGPVAGSFLLYAANGTTPINGATLGTYTSGGVGHMYDLLDDIDAQVPACLALVGKPAVDFIIGFQGEANAGANANDTVSTVGGVATFAAYRDKRLEFVQLMRSRGYANSATKFIDFELARANSSSAEKPRNDVMAILPNIYTAISVVPSAGYFAADTSHIDDHWGIGYYKCREIIEQTENAQQGTIPIPFYVRQSLRNDGTIGFKRNVINLDQQTLDLSGMSYDDYRSYLLGTCFVMRSSRLILPAFAVAAYDLGMTWRVMQWSVTGTTPGYGDGNSRIELSGFTFTDGRTGTTASGVLSLTSADNAKALTFEFLRTSNIYYGT